MPLLRIVLTTEKRLSSAIARSHDIAIRFHIAASFYSSMWAFSRFKWNVFDSRRTPGLGLAALLGNSRYLHLPVLDIMSSDHQRLLYPGVDRDDKPASFLSTRAEPLSRTSRFYIGAEEPFAGPNVSLVLGVSPS